MELESTPSLDDIEMVVRHIVDRFHPEKVILFGSCAYGQPHDGSDLDLLVVTSSVPSRQEGWKVVHRLRQYSLVPLQIIFMSPQEFAETKDVVGGIAYPAHHGGRVIYESNP